MLYRIVIEMETDEPRDFVNNIAQNCMNETVTRKSVPVYLATEIVQNKQRVIIKEVD